MSKRTLLIVILSVILIWCFYRQLFSPSTISYRAFRAFNCAANSECVIPDHIPRVIYRSWKTKDLQHDHQLAWDVTAKNNPGYQQTLFDDNEMDHFMETFYSGRVNNAYKKIIPNAARADLFRYCLIYKRGGVWLDMKSAAKPLCNLIRKDDKLIVSTWDKNPVHFLCGLGPWYDFGEFQQWWIISAPNHPMLKGCIELVVDNIETRVAEGRFQKESKLNILGVHWIGSTAADIVNTTGPIAFSKALLKYKSISSDYRLVCPNGNDTFIYDYTGHHKGGHSYGGKGLFFREE